MTETKSTQEILSALNNLPFYVLRTYALHEVLLVRSPEYRGRLSEVDAEIRGSIFTDTVTKDLDEASKLLSAGLDKNDPASLIQALQTITSTLSRVDELIGDFRSMISRIDEATLDLNATPTHTGCLDLEPNFLSHALVLEANEYEDREVKLNFNGLTKIISDLQSSSSRPRSFSEQLAIRCLQRYVEINLGNIRKISGTTSQESLEDLLHKFEISENLVTDRTVEWIGRKMNSETLSLHDRNRMLAVLAYHVEKSPQIAFPSTVLTNCYSGIVEGLKCGGDTALFAARAVPIVGKSEYGEKRWNEIVPLLIDVATKFTGPTREIASLKLYELGVAKDKPHEITKLCAMLIPRGGDLRSCRIGHMLTAQLDTPPGKLMATALEYVDSCYDRKTTEALLTAATGVVEDDCEVINVLSQNEKYKNPGYANFIDRILTAYRAKGSLLADYCLVDIVLD